MAASKSMNSSTIVAPSGPRTIDVAGGTVMPGMSDAHVQVCLADLDLGVASRRRARATPNQAHHPILGPVCADHARDNVDSR